MQVLRGITTIQGGKIFIGNKDKAELSIRLEYENTILPRPTNWTVLGNEGLCR